MSTVSPTILVIDDEPPIRKLLRMGLMSQGYDVLEAPNGKLALELLAKKPALVILDLGLPDIDGLDLLRRIRSRQENLPIVVLSSRGDEAGKVAALDLGADDYVTKPFGTLELIARVRALLRRMGRRDQPPLPAIERFGDIEVNPASRMVYRAGRAVGLTPREFDLLLALLARRGAVGSRADLLREVWGYQAEVMSRTVDMHVAELRRKLEHDPATPRHILTVWKVGYRLER
jgi:two-component system KDP operon response regulator KdpE